MADGSHLLQAGIVVRDLATQAVDECLVVFTGKKH